jgi:methyl-accepting chemotaxis protein
MLNNIKIKSSLTGKLIFTLCVTLLVLISIYTIYAVRENRKLTEGYLEEEGFALAKGAALALQTVVENDIKKGVITEKALFDRNYKLLKDDPEPDKRKYGSAFDRYTDSYWQGFVDAFLANDNILFAAPVANGEGDMAGYLPTHNTKYKERSKRIFNDTVGAKSGNSGEPLKQVYKRDTGEMAWNISYPIFVNGRHWGGFRIALSLANVEARVAAERNKIIFTMALVTVILTGVILIISRIILSRPLSKVLKATEDLAVGEGDLTQRLIIYSNDEIGAISRYINTFIEKLQVMVRNLGETVENVAKTGTELSQNSKQNAIATKQVAAAIEEVTKGNSEQTANVNQTVEITGQLIMAIEQIAKGAQEQSQNVIRTADIVNQMASAIQDVAANSQHVSAGAAKTAEVAAKGGEAVKKTVEGMERIRQSVFETANRIKELGEHSQQIGEIIQVIDDIAEQTNLLALNAAIEAARAGEHGKGFAVVADEVRKLAERSSKATKEIADLITNIQHGTDNAVKAMEIGTGEVEVGAQLAHDAGLALEAIVQQVNQAVNQIESISAASEEMAASSTEVIKAIDNVSAITEENTAASEQMTANSNQVMNAMQNIAAISEENAAAAEEVSASTEQLNNSTEEIAASAENLEKTAEELQIIVRSFKV